MPFSPPLRTLPYLPADTGDAAADSVKWAKALSPTFVPSSAVLPSKALKRQWMETPYIQALLVGLLSPGFGHKSLGRELGGIYGRDTGW